MSRELHKEYRLEDGSKCYYSSTRFAKLIKEICRDTEDGIIKSKQELLEDIAEQTGISASSMNHWIMGHNAPSDYEKLVSIADALELDIFEFVEKEEEPTKLIEKDEKIMMNDKEQKNIETTLVMPSQPIVIDYSDTKNIVREIFTEISEYIETFRKTVAFEYNEIGDTFDMFYSSEKFSKIYCLIRKSMLDLPFGLYKELLLFCKGYLVDMMGDEYDPIEIWDIKTMSDEELIEQGFSIDNMNPYHRRFIGYKNYMEQNDTELYRLQIDYVEMIADNAYEILEVMLKDFLVK